VNELIVAVVPIRSLRDGKTRLSPILAPDERAAFLRHSAERVITTALDSRVVDTVLVVSPDPAVLAWSADFGRRVYALAQPADQPGLNGAIAAARDWALERDADGILSLFADLPLISIFDIRRLMARRNSIVLGPDRRGEGTNAMLLRLAGRGEHFRFAFGEGSLAKHVAEARRLGLSVAVEDIPGIGFDLDTPLDWSDYLAVEGGRVPGPLREATFEMCGANLG
jgi:2-phospho-L-lactate guanylyltransferase